jgi:hypothetical protein
MPSARFLPAALLAGALLALGACAAQPAPLAASDGAAADRSGCIPTGSRIRTRDGECSPRGYPFRSYSAEELQATGEIDLLEALRQIDPAFQ